jgi:Homeodomain-like domain
MKKSLPFCAWVSPPSTAPDNGLSRGGLPSALTERRRPGAIHKLDGKQEAFLVALACSTPPAGRVHWTMQLLAERLVALQLVEAVSDETVRRVLKKTTSSRGSAKNGASPV